MTLENYFPENYVVIDVETSGLDPYRDRILEVGFLEIRNREVSLPACSWVLNPNFPDDGFVVLQKIMDLTGITTEEVTNGQDPLLVLKKLQSLCDRQLIVSHNGIRFDRQFLNRECERFEVEKFNPYHFLDTAALFKGWRLEILDLLESMDFYDFANTVLGTKAYGVYFNLPYCCEVLGIDISDLGKSHRAGVDVVMTHQVMERLREILVVGELPSFGEYIKSSLAGGATE